MTRRQRRVRRYQQSEIPEGRRCNRGAGAKRCASRPAIVQVKADPHSPHQFRANGTLMSQTGFYETFKIKERNTMHLVPQERVIIR